MSSAGFVTYIDEAGDDGLGNPKPIGGAGQSHWLVLSAVIVPQDADSCIPGWRDDITRALNTKKKKNLHFADLNHDQKVFATRTLSAKPFGCISVMSYKISIDHSGKDRHLRQKNILYKYLLRILLERVTDACRRRCRNRGTEKRPTELYFSRRGGMDYEDFRQYMTHLRDLQTAKGGWYKVDWDCVELDTIQALDHPNRAGLQIADVVASSFFKAVEPNRFGDYEARYAENLRPRVIPDDNGRKLNFGVTPVPTTSQLPETTPQMDFLRSWE